MIQQQRQFENKKLCTIYFHIVLFWYVSVLYTNRYRNLNKTRKKNLLTEKRYRKFKKKNKNHIKTTIYSNTGCVCVYLQQQIRISHTALQKKKQQHHHHHCHCCRRRCYRHSNSEYENIYLLLQRKCDGNAYIFVSKCLFFLLRRNYYFSYIKLLFHISTQKFIQFHMQEW